MLLISLCDVVYLLFLFLLWNRDVNSRPCAAGANTLSLDPGTHSFCLIYFFQIRSPFFPRLNLDSNSLTHGLPGVVGLIGMSQYT
jgi:hypothetical protein